MKTLKRECSLVKSFVKEAHEYRREYPEWFEYSDVLSFYFPWRRTMNAEGHCLEHEIPWLTFPVVDYLERFLEPEMRVFEYGSGGSTVFFARRVQEVVSIEHDSEWLGKLRNRLDEEAIENCTVHHIPPSLAGQKNTVDPADPDSYASGNKDYEGMSFRDYVQKIDAYPDCYFDVVIVDGRARPSCFKHAIPKVCEGGVLVFDNTTREWYQPATELAPEEFEFYDYPGPAPFLRHFTKTSIWKNTQ
ncbi:protein-L-isoaspartate O-methyltransferase [Salinibacter ruber]|uniref:protein-L-isoaspartate O-methyltransferase n=1 Tax=Salinibacter ruber TaxID=146919 RepID=UPI00207478DE|nr:protein-L-isoaspartate O-methyltransferase [Salinibacter ruber]MCS4114594.1 hypothetical protein [Salinibacter ruber]MCS4181773.1 hypothetical protein [Salinibacter ruber]